MSNQGKDLITRDGDFLKIILPDAIGMDDSQHIQSEIKNHLSDKEEQLVIDLSKTTAIYSSGIGLLIRLEKVIKASGGAIFLVNVSRKLRDVLSDLNLDRVFHIYATDVEFDLSKDEIWKKKLAEEDSAFIFVAQIENGIYRLTFSGQMSSLHDLSSVSEFTPDKEVEYIVINLESLDLMDTYGAQLFNDFIERIQNMGKKCVIYGAVTGISELFELLPSLNSYTFYKTEKEALASIQK